MTRINVAACVLWLTVLGILSSKVCFRLRECIDLCRDRQSVASNAVMQVHRFSGCTFKVEAWLGQQPHCCHFTGMWHCLENALIVCVASFSDCGFAAYSCEEQRHCMSQLTLTLIKPWKLQGPFIFFEGAPSALNVDRTGNVLNWKAAPSLRLTDPVIQSAQMVAELSLVLPYGQPAFNFQGGTCWANGGSRSLSAACVVGLCCWAKCRPLASRSNY